MTYVIYKVPFHMVHHMKLVLKYRNMSGFLQNVINVRK